MARYTYIFTFLLISIFSGQTYATPSTQIWNPSTDIQAAGTNHIGIDNYFTIEGPSHGGYAFPTDVGLTYWIMDGLEAGIDVFMPQNSPLSFNAKYAVPESASMPAFAVGGFGFGAEAGVTDQNVLYMLGAKTFEFGRISAGYFAGNENVLGAGESSGPILTWDKAITDKLWASIDYAGTRSVLGSTFYGFSWLFAKNVSVIFGYGTFNSGAKPVVTTQLDINL